MHAGTFADVILQSAHVGGTLSLTGARVTGRLNMDSLRVDQTAFLSRSAEFAGPVNFIFAKLGHLELAGGHFHADVDLTGTQILGELRLGLSRHEPAQWSEKSTLILRNVRVDSIQDLTNAWPSYLELDGFMYRNLGGINAAGDSMAHRPTGWFKDWLGKQQLYAPAPYEQLAAVLRGQGRLETADEILFANISPCPRPNGSSATATIYGGRCSG
jgi:hypothetical protein